MTPLDLLCDCTDSDQFTYAVQQNIENIWT
jgi:hypothetical protein